LVALAMSKISKGFGATAGIALAIAIGAGGLLLYRMLHRNELSGVVKVALDRPDDWKEYGGTWQYVNGVMRNISDERGAMLMNSSPEWSNYSVEADVLLLGQYGDAGLILRATDEEEGVDAYHGYMAGLRDLDNALLLGRADYGWREYVAKSLPPRVYVQQWYHIKFLAYNCDFAVSATAPSGETTSAGVEDPGCQRAGRFGLKSYNTGAEWKNVVVRPATAQDLAAITGGATLRRAVPDEYPFGTVPAPDERYFEPLRRDLEAHESDLNASPIGSLRLLPPGDSTQVTVRGVVTLTSPVLYVQDSTAGLVVHAAHMVAPVGIGDEVEARGDVVPHDFSSELQHAEVRPLWSHTPVLPVVVTAFQAATGAFDAHYVEIEGMLNQVQEEAGGRRVLVLDEGSQSFRAIAAGEGMGTRFKDLKPKSRLRLRGICVVDPAYTQDQTSFAILLPSLRDVEVLAGPPWWTTGHIIALIVGVLMATLLALVLYIRMERWRMRAVLEERQRLAHDMHDTLAQSFAGLGFQLEAMQGELQEGGDVAPQLEAAREMVRNSHEEARRSLAALRPEHLESVGLLEALKNCSTRMINGKGCIVVETTSQGNERSIPPGIADTLLRIGQEAIANAVRHAHPKHLRISVNYTQNNVELVVADDGQGFQMSSASAGFGIRGMHKRAAGVGAKLSFESAAGEGTLVRVRALLPPSLPVAAWQALRKIRPKKRKRDELGTA
jgi:signal transduction histidine kinase